jgi:hypothetical protein
MVSGGHMKVENSFSKPKTSNELSFKTKREITDNDFDSFLARVGLLIKKIGDITMIEIKQSEAYRALLSKQASSPETPHAQPSDNSQ